jgi:2-C-methyl-D-erythritol 2,4-cyclodiphosphate synthase
MIGLGYDSHRFAAGESLIIGGINIPCEYGTVAHSDGDALLHALIDSLLGAAGLGDIGELFPDNDMKYKNADSCKLTEEVIRLIYDKKYEIINIDATVVLEKPKLKEFKPKIKERIAELCKISAAQVNIKAKTNEKLGFTGRSEGIACYCVCQLERKKD